MKRFVWDEEMNMVTSVGAMHHAQESYAQPTIKLGSQMWQSTYQTVSWHHRGVGLPPGFRISLYGRCRKPKLLELANPTYLGDAVF